MPDDSYTLKEVAEMLGVSKRTLQRRIREGAFPHRFLAPGRHGLETRIPSADVRQMVDDTRVRPIEVSSAGLAEVVPRNRTSLLPQNALALSPTSTALVGVDEMDTLRETVVSMVRQERETMLQMVKQSLEVQEQDTAELRSQISSILGAVDRLRRRVETLVGAPDELEMPAPAATDDYGAKLLGEIEALLSRVPRS